MGWVYDIGRRKVAGFQANNHAGSAGVGEGGAETLGKVNHSLTVAMYTYAVRMLGGPLH